MHSGLSLTLLIGKKVPAPASTLLLDALQEVEVSSSDGEHDGFKIVFNAGRSGSADASDYPLLNSPLLKLFNRVIIMVSFGVVPKVLIDGILAHQQLNPSPEPGKSTITVIGEDISVLMDLKEKTETFPGQTDVAKVTRIIGAYSQYGLKPDVVTPASMEVPLEVNTVTSQRNTDLAYLRNLAKEYAHVFYIEPTDAPGVNTAYWGPSIRSGAPQKAITFNMGPFTNAVSINFQNDALAQTSVGGKIQDPITGAKFEIPSLPSSLPSLSGQPSAGINEENQKSMELRESGLSVTQMLIKAQSGTNESSDSVTVTGELDSMRYGDVLHARRLVGLRGVGKSYDGYYYVKKVVHTIVRGEYKQHFTLTRSGVRSTTSTVIP